MHGPKWLVLFDCLFVYLFAVVVAVVVVGGGGVVVIADVAVDAAAVVEHGKRKH